MCFEQTISMLDTIHTDTKTCPISGPGPISRPVSTINPHTLSLVLPCHPLIPTPTTMAATCLCGSRRSGMSVAESAFMVPLPAVSVQGQLNTCISYTERRLSNTLQILQHRRIQGRMDSLHLRFVACKPHKRCKNTRSAASRGLYGRRGPCRCR